MPQNEPNFLVIIHSFFAAYGIKSLFVIENVQTGVNGCEITLIWLIPEVICVFADFSCVPTFPFPASTLRPPDHSNSRGREKSLKEHGIWGVILFVLGVTCSTELGLSATVWKFIRGTNSSLIVIPSGEQSVSPAECWRGDRLLQDDN